MYSLGIKREIRGGGALRLYQYQVVIEYGIRYSYILNRVCSVDKFAK